MLLLLLVANFWHIYDQQFSTRGFHQLLNFTDVRVSVGIWLVQQLLVEPLQTSSLKLFSFSQNRVLCDAGVFVICILATIATMILFPDEVGNEDGIDLKGFKLLLSSLTINTGIYAGFRLLTNVGLGILMVAVGGYVFVRG